MWKYVLGALGVVAVAVVVAFVVIFFVATISRGASAQPLEGADSEPRPFVTAEPGDQKANMGLYDEAKGPLWGMPQVGMISLPIGVCAKPAVVIDFDEHGNSIYAEDDEVIWRCVQTGHDGRPLDAPLVYCHQQIEQPRLSAIAWMCHHNYGRVFNWYEQDHKKSPLVLPDEIEFIETTEFRQ